MSCAGGAGARGALWTVTDSGATIPEREFREKEEAIFHLRRR